jgi:hypothetical protein
MKLFGSLLLSSLILAAQPRLELLNQNRPLLDAHNCYPYHGEWADRIERALKTGFPVAIEQDIAWANNQPVLSHAAGTTGKEPTLRDYFFERVRRIVEKELKAKERSHWPIVVLHFDFKSLDVKLLRAVWNLLGEYEDWITTASQTKDPRELAALDVKPLLVLTEDADEQEQVFFRDLKPGARLRLFGSAHTTKIEVQSPKDRVHLVATMRPEALLREAPTNYRRWWNNSWAEVEEGGQRRAGEWTATDNLRLRALVDHAHRLGYWIRFYTLDGFTPDQQRGWDESYNFGSREAVVKRWRAAYEAGVDLIATDQYEDLAALLSPLHSR